MVSPGLRPLLSCTKFHAASIYALSQSMLVTVLEDLDERVIRLVSFPMLWSFKRILTRVDAFLEARVGCCSWPSCGRPMRELRSVPLTPFDGALRAPPELLIGWTVMTGLVVLRWLVWRCS